MSDIAKKIKHYRTINGYTQREFAKKIGVANVVMSRYESRDRTPDKDTQIKIAEIFEISLDELNGRKSKIIESFDNMDVLMFNDKAGFDNLSDEDKQELKDLLNEQLEYLIYKENKGDK